METRHLDQDQHGSRPQGVYKITLDEAESLFGIVDFYYIKDNTGLRQVSAYTWWSEAAKDHEENNMMLEINRFPVRSGDKFSATEMRLIYSEAGFNTTIPWDQEARVVTTVDVMGFEAMEVARNLVGRCKYQIHEGGGLGGEFETVDFFRFSEVYHSNIDDGSDVRVLLQILANGKYRMILE